MACATAHATTSNEFAHLQDVMGSLPMVKRYIVLCLCFSLHEQTSGSVVSDVVNTLRQSLKRLANAFPYLAGQVIFEGKDQDHSGVPKIVPLGDNSIELIVNDLRQDARFPSMGEMRTSNYPFSCFDPAMVAPPIASTWTADESGVTAPVLLLQANFVDGGLILLVAGNHMTMDMTGMGLVISLFSQACRDEAFTEEQIEQGNQSRNNAIPLFDNDSEPDVEELHDVIVQPTSERIMPKFQSTPTWAYFDFKAHSLRRLKEEASRQDLVSFISTDDAVGAFCWQRVSKVREARFGSGSKSTFTRPISVRNYFGLKGYIGHMVDCTYENEVDVWKYPLGEIAGRLRRLLRQDEKIVHHARAFATALARADDKSIFSNGAHLDPTRDLVLSSYANIKCCDLSFGPLLGCPDAARRPRMPAWPSLCYMMPKTRDGAIAVALCLEEDELKLLRKDEIFGSFAEYVG